MEPAAAELPLAIDSRRSPEVTWTGQDADGLVPVYRCPGETAPISSGVHFSRLSRFYHQCRHCEFRGDVVRLAPSIQRQWKQLLDSPEPPRLFSINGVRGLTLNQLTRSEASQVAAAYAATLREVLEIWRNRRPTQQSCRMKVVFGHDGRSSSPELAAAAASTLRQHGCELLDIGWSTRPQLDFALKQCQAEGAFFVTGQGCPAGWNGVDMIGPDGIVWSRDGVLDLVEQHFHQSCPRHERDAFPLSVVDLSREQQAFYKTLLHGFRPWRVSVVAEDPTVERFLSSLLSDWPGELHLAQVERDYHTDQTAPHEISHTGATRSAISHSPPAVISSALPQSASLDVAFHIQEDARQIALRDEQQQQVSSERIVFGLGELLLDEHPHVDVILSDDYFDHCGWTVERCGPGYLVFHRGGNTEEQLLRTMSDHQSPLAVDGQGRYWVRHQGTIQCDAVLTLILILQALGRSDLRTSEWGKQVSTRSSSQSTPHDNPPIQISVLP